VPPTVGRRRLSVSNTGGEDVDDADVTEEDRGLIAGLNERGILDIVAAAGIAGGDRRMSIASNTDDAKKSSFDPKSIQQFGADFDPLECGIGYTCRKGLKPESPNQDSWFVLKTEQKAIYAVFDGHGKKGHDVSNFAKENLPKLMLQHSNFNSKADEPVRVMMREVFARTQSLIVASDRMKTLSAQMSGTTATVVLHDTEAKRLHVAHVADSTAVLGGKTARAITLDHKPDLKAERARIEKNGGRVVFDGYANHRVYARNARFPGLNMSRCLGDLMGHEHCGLSCEPEIRCHELSGDDAVLLVCSDGVWEFITPQEAVDIVMSYPPSQAGSGANKLAKEAWDRWMREEGGEVVDDITVVVVHLQTEAPD